MKKRLNIITVLAPSDRGIYGQFVSSSKTIYINPSLSSSTTLTGEERTRLYMAHELGHVIHEDWKNTVRNHLVLMDDSPMMKQAMYDGFCLIDEATTQNRAEDIAYYFASKKRPERRLSHSSLFDGEEFLTNFDYYGELQGPAILFGKTLRGIGNSKTDEEALSRLSSRTLSSRFVDDVFFEYKKDGHYEDLKFLLVCLGIIKKASYAQFGYSDAQYIKRSSSALHELRRVAGPLRDPRQPFRSE